MPITQRELSALECSVTLLTDFESISDPMDWQIGKHGLRINFTHNGRRYGSTYLPDVAREQAWTKEETLISLMRKAGWNGRRSTLPRRRKRFPQISATGASVAPWRQFWGVHASLRARSGVPTTSTTARFVLWER